jgi:hypothetical protein
MNEQIKSLTNFLNPAYSDYLEDLINNGTLPLFLSGATYLNENNINDPRIKNEKESCQLCHGFWQDGVVRSNFWAHVEPIVYNFMAVTNVTKAENLSRCKLNFNYRDTSYAKDEHFPIHVDKQTGITAIYYVNDSDGDTLFFNDDKEIIYSFTPKKGALVYFPSHVLHAGKPPKLNSYRAVINLNWS